MFIEIETQKNSEESQEIHFQNKAESQFEHDQINAERRVEPWHDRFGEYVLNRPWGGQDPQNLS